MEEEPLEPVVPELQPLEPNPEELGTVKNGCHRTWYWGPCSALVIFSLIAFIAFSGKTSSELAVSEGLEDLTGLSSTTSCSAVDCKGNFARHGSAVRCDGKATSQKCINTCCTREIKCSRLGAGFCGGVGAGFSRRVITFLDEGLPLRTGTCKGEENCKSACCQGLCRKTTCPADRCPMPYAPRKCTYGSCEEQCCYDKEEYCGWGPNAYTRACRKCKDTLTYCEEKLGISRSSVTRDEWNRIVMRKVEQGKLVPGCEEDHYLRCEDTKLKFSLTTVFPFHKTAEGVSANTVAVLPGGTEAISGGNDGTVWDWRIADGKPLKNFTEDTNPILQVAPFNDATYFCSVSQEQAIVWLLQLRDGLEVPGRTELPQDDRKHKKTAPGNTACIGLNTWETAVVGQNNSFVVIWHWKADASMTVPVDPELQWIQQIRTDAGYHQWPKWDKSSQLMDAFIRWRRHIFGLDRDYDRRLKEVNMSELMNSKAPITPESDARQLRRSVSPWPNYFSNIRWGDVPHWYYEPDNGWGKVISLVEIPSNLWFVVGYEYGSIRIWKSYNGFLQAIIPQAHIGRVNALLAQPAGDQFWSGGDDGWIRLWQAGNGHPVRSHYAVYAGQVKSLAMIPGGNAFYSGHSNGKVYVWLVYSTDNKETDWPICHFNPKGGVVNSLAVNPGSIGQILVALQDGLIKVYTQGR
ncbi:unnamed protein product [Durusdinium trenchii]|uniref:Uncharacterized protein n=1 Tax=Durusdinium trenchii TaxID=1381693 RepID=A0ABP0PHH0_9DINO